MPLDKIPLELLEMIQKDKEKKETPRPKWRTKQEAKMMSKRRKKDKMAKLSKRKNRRK